MKTLAGFYLLRHVDLVSFLAVVRENKTTFVE